MPYAYDERKQGFAIFKIARGSLGAMVGRRAHSKTPCRRGGKLRNSSPK